MSFLIIIIIITDHQKIVTDDYIDDPTAVTNFVHIRPRGLLGEWVKYN